MFYWYFKKKLNRAFKKNDRNKNFRSFDNMASILILFDKEDYEQTSLIAKDMRSNGKRVTLWTMSIDEPHDLPAINGLKVIGKKDVWGGGSPKSDILDAFKDLEYDTLLNLASIDKEKYDTLSYLLAINKAEFCIGIEKPEIYKPFDFVLLREPGSSFMDTYKEIKRYTGNLR